MSTFDIIAISVQPSFATRNTNGDIIPPGGTVTVWTPPGNQYIDGPGSTQPVTFALPLAGPLNAPYAIHVAGICAVPSQLAGRTYQVIGCLPGNPNPIAVFRNSDSTNIIGPSGITPVQATGFIVDRTFINLPEYKVPFRIVGDLQWRVVITGQPDVIAPSTTRLEFAFARTAAPSGPTEITDPTTRTMINLGGIYPVRVQRAFFPFAAELEQPDYLPNPRLWFLSRVAYYVWGYGNSPTAGRPRYDVVNGASFFGVSGMGGNVNFDAWLNGSITTCNCFDLAAMVQLGCCMLLDNAGHGIYELSDSRWVFQDPTGYIFPCVLYGWGRVGTAPPDFPIGLNNPFFGNFPPPYPYIGSVSANTRLPFARHGFVEAYAQDPGLLVPRKTLDCTTATWDATTPVPQPDYASRTRTEYLTRHIDVAADPTVGKIRTGNANDRIQSNPMSNGSCWLNNDAWMVRTTDPLKKYRIGVWNVSAIPLPTYLSCLLSGSLPKSLMDEIDAVIEKVALHRGHGIRRRFSDATLSAQSITNILSRVDPRMTILESSVHVTGESSLLDIIVNGAQVSDSVSGRIALSIHTFNDDALAFASVIHMLSGYTVSPLADIFERTSSELGHLSMVDTTHTSLYFVRGNHFVSVRFMADPDQLLASGLTALSESDPDHVVAIAELVHSHLASNEVPPGHQHAPHLRFQERHRADSNPGGPLEKTVRVGENFKLSVTTDDANESGDDFAILRGESANGGVVICTSNVQQAGHDNMTNAIQFLAVDEGETEVYVYAGHRDTLVPGSLACKVTVLPAEVEE